MHSVELADYLPLEDLGRLFDADPLGPDGRISFDPVVTNSNLRQTAGL